MLDGGMLRRGEGQSSRGNGFWGGVISNAPCWANFRSDKNSRQPILTAAFVGETGLEALFRNTARYILCLT